jgi:phosphate transport system protein
MTRENFERELQKLQDEVLILGSMAEQAVLDAVTALRQMDRKAARQIRKGDQQINEKRYQIEKDTLIAIATQQPMARDLRFLAAILEIITELERIGDYAKGIAGVVLALDKENVDIPKGDLKRMADLGLDMLQRALTAFLARDAETARAIPPEDDQVDALYNRIYHKLLKQIMDDPSTVDNATRLMWAAHDLERMADRVTNICERIVFVVTGEIKELDHTEDETDQPKNKGELSEGKGSKNTS